MKLITGITNGKPENLDQFFENCKYYEGKKVDILIERHKDKRSNPQNRYWWGVMLKHIQEFMNELGHDHSVQDWHDYYVNKGYFGYKDIMNIRVPKGSSESTTLEFNEAVEKIRREWAERGLAIPDPNQEEFL